MIYVKTFEEYNNYNDELIVEKLNLEPLFNKFKNAVDKASVASIIVGSLLTVFTITQAVTYVSNLDILSSIEKTELFKELRKKETHNKIKSIKSIINKDDADYNVEFNKLSSRKLFDVANLNISNNGLKQIKKHEKLELKAYDIKDGMITIGYGHANPKRKSPYKVGDKISIEKADELLRIDLKVAEDGVKRIFSQWQKKDINVRITQGQYDAMVSMAFNMGVGGLRRSKFIQYVKKNDMKRAAEEIKKTGLKKGFPGLAIRRKSESEKFNS